MADKLERNTFLLLLVLVTLLFFRLLVPFFGAIFWAMALTVIFLPLQQRLRQRFRLGPNTAALTTLLCCILVAVVPVTLVLISGVQQGIDLYQKLQSGEIDYATYVDSAKAAFPQVIELLDRVGIDPDGVRKQFADAAVLISQFVAKRSLTIGQNALNLTVSIVLMLYLTFFFLRDSRQLLDLLIRALPLGDARERLLIAKFAEVTRATVKGNLVVAATQGALGGLIFWVLDVQAALLWGVVMAIASLVPAVGAALIWGPVAIYFLVTGDYASGIVLIAFGAGVIGLVDNLLRPVLVGRDTRMPDYLVLLSTLGGFALFGMNGFVIGPLVAALFLAFWDIFIREFNPETAGTQ